MVGSCSEAAPAPGRMDNDEFSVIKAAGYTDQQLVDIRLAIARNLEATLIQDWKPIRNLESNNSVPGFVCFKIQFHIVFAETFSTVSTRSGHEQFPHCCNQIKLSTNITADLFSVFANRHCVAILANEVS
jgi:hypothetical protein